MSRRQKRQEFIPNAPERNDPRTGDALELDDELLGLKEGYAQVPHVLTRDHSLPPGPYRVYVNLLSYAWQKDTAFPSQERLAYECAISVRSVRDHLRFLQDKGLLSWKRRGLGKSNIYTLHCRVVSGAVVSSREFKVFEGLK